MKKTARILALVLVLVFLFSTVAYAADEPRQADVGERTSWEKNAEVNEKYAPRVKVMENGVRVQKTPYNTTALDTQAGDVESKTITAWNNYFLNADNRGCTALMRAAYIGYPELVKYLLSKGADKNQKDYDGNLPIHYVRKECLADLKGLLKVEE